MSSAQNHGVLCAALISAMVALLSLCAPVAHAQVSAADITTFVDLHNLARGAVIPTATSMPAVVWDTTVAATAQAYANTCPSGHSGSSYGENLAWGWPSQSITSAVNAWVAEKSYYTLSSNTCQSGKACGHYTQVVWANTLRIGCGRKTCPNIFNNGVGDVTVCNYDPPGNYVGQKPYVTGTSCSQCATGLSCNSNNLCVPPPGPCGVNPCKNGGTCFPTANGTSSTCRCATNFAGSDCSENWSLAPTLTSVDQPVLPIGCLNTITLTGNYFFGSNLSCIFSNGDRIPANRLSYTQARCRVPSVALNTTSLKVGISRSGVQATAVINLTFGPSCCNNPCKNGGLCGPTNNITFTCDCSRTGFSGTYCQIPINECASSPCKNNGVCTDLLRAFSCNCTNTGYQGPTCQSPLSCPAASDAISTFPSTHVATISYGTCVSGYYGNPTRVCLTSLTFGPVMNPCQLLVNCTVETYANAVWPLSLPNSIATGACITGYSGAPKRTCTKSGVWATLVNYHCARITCAANTLAGAAFPSTYAGFNGTGTCPTGQYGNPIRLCQANGTWGPNTGTVCQIASDCPTMTYGRVVWPTTFPGVTATGTCVPPYVSSAAGSPVRVCQKDGTWSTLINNHCTLP